MTKVILFIFFVALIGNSLGQEATEEPVTETVEPDLGASREALRTDDDVIKREEEAIKLDGLNVAQIKELREKAEKFHFQAEVNRMMKLIINSLYRNKEIFLRELISNAADALDKIRLLSLTDKSVLDSNPELGIRIKADKDNHILHIIDSGIGMTRKDLVNNLGTIAKSGTAEFLAKMQDIGSSSDFNDMIGQFGVGFYSAFLVADRVIVTSKHNDDNQHIWESDAENFSVVEDPRGNTLKRGSQISLHLKEEAYDFLEEDTLKNLVKKYSQFINFPISLWCSKVVKIEEPVEAEEAEKEDKGKEEDAAVEEEKDDKATSKSIDKTVWDWEILNDSKPIWTRKPADIEESEYIQFYKSLTKDKSEPLAKSHFVAEGEVTFKSLLFVPPNQPSESFSKYGTRSDNIKAFAVVTNVERFLGYYAVSSFGFTQTFLPNDAVGIIYGPEKLKKLYVRRVFITDEFNDMMPNYLAFIQGVVDSDDLPLNVSRETLQQHKLIKIIKKKLVRKALDMIKSIKKEDYEKFWKEYSTNIKLGVIEDSSNRTRLAKLLMFQSSLVEGMTNLGDYVSRMKPNQKHIYYIAGASRSEVEKSPFVERLLKKGYEVLYLVEAVDEYCLSAIPEFDGKRFQNVAKEDFTLPDDKGNSKHLAEKFEPLLNWLSKNALKDKILKASVSERLSDSPCALVASVFGWTGNMERLALSNAHQKSNDVQRNYYLNQKKALEINPRHPLIRELLRRVIDDENDKTANDIALMMFRTATLRSGYMLSDTAEFARSVESLMRQTLGVPLDAEPEEEEEIEEENGGSEDMKELEAEETEEHDEL